MMNKYTWLIMLVLVLLCVFIFCAIVLVDERSGYGSDGKIYGKIVVKRSIIGNEETRNVIDILIVSNFIKLKIDQGDVNIDQCELAKESVCLYKRLNNRNGDVVAIVFKTSHPNQYDIAIYEDEKFIGFACSKNGNVVTMPGHK